MKFKYITYALALICGLLAPPGYYSFTRKHYCGIVELFIDINDRCQYTPLAKFFFLLLLLSMIIQHFLDEDNSDDNEK